MERFAARRTSCLRRLACDRAEEVRFGRFLANARVSVSDIVANWSSATRSAVAGRHVLAIQDTSEVNFRTTAEHRRDLGKIGRGVGCGALLHAMLACDAEDLGWLGLVTGSVWTRAGAVTARARRPLGEKESARWVATAQAAKPILAAARLVTFVSDRESDVFDLWALVPETGFELIVRARHDRVLAGGGKISSVLAGWTVADTRLLDLPARSAFEPARQAHVVLRFGAITLARPANHIDKTLPDRVMLTLVEVEERDPPAGIKPVRWTLLTTHAVDSVTAAWRIVDWYKARWAIEQLFRVLKVQGFDVEASQVQDAARLLKLIALATHGACLSMQLVHCREDHVPQAVERIFSDPEVAIIEALSEGELAGRTPKQRNPNPKRTIAYAAWVIARLGGWKGYRSERPPGHVTMLRGIQRFKDIADGWALAENRRRRDLCMP